MFYEHVPFSMRPRQEPQQHYEVQGGCGCSPVDVGFQTVPVANVLGMSFQQQRFELTIVTREFLLHFYKCRAREPRENKGWVLFSSFQL